MTRSSSSRSRHRRPTAATTSMMETAQERLSSSPTAAASPAKKKKQSKKTCKEVTPSPNKKKKRNAPAVARKRTTTSSSSSRSSSRVARVAPSTASDNDDNNKTSDMVLTSRQVAMVPTAAAHDSDQYNNYVDLNVPPTELRPSATLTIGQCFHWKVVQPDNDDDNSGKVSSSSPSSSPTTSTSASAWGTHDSTEWVGVLRLTPTLANDDDHDDDNDNDNSIVISMKETPNTTLYRVLHQTFPNNNTTNYSKVLADYFQLDQPLTPLYRQWSQSDPTNRMAHIADCIPGVRIIEQDPWECLVSFICSSNNNIPRITQMLQSLRRRYGTALITIGTETLYSFPSLKTLRRDATDAELRDIGMGYRAKYLMETMELLHSLGGEDYLHKLRTIQDPTVVQGKLTQFSGVGRKVADCVALFSLRQANAIPVDTHVWNIAKRDFDTDGTLATAKSLTPTIYNQVGDMFRRRFPQQAGWAHSLLFVAELPSFRPILYPIFQNSFQSSNKKEKRPPEKQNEKGRIRARIDK